MPGPKKAQRTKGNVKPSSSSQAAQLLAASGHAPTGFIGFSNQPAFVPVSETFDEAESMLDGDFRLVLRKLSKRDAVTKIKALQEFSSLCVNKDEEVVKSVVSFWPRIYNKVAIDVDHKVRELTQKATSSLAAKAGKAMAPHLKSIMGMWVVSMCDTYPTVASAANQAFTSRFPGHKQAEAIRFCAAEIAECLLKNIMNHTKQTLSDPQTTSEEDMEAKYQRVVSSSLQGLRKVLVMLPSNSVVSTMSDHISTLTQSPAFWKHAKSTVPAVKGGMLSLLSAACQLCPSAVESSISKISPFVFSCLDSAESSIVSYAWEAVLSLVSTRKDCWQHTNWQKAVWPKIKKVLENGCSGQATIVAPCLLPFLSKIPNVNFAQFFESFRLGFTEESVVSSPSELNALVKSFQECLHYAVKSLHTGVRMPEARDLVMDQLLLVVQGSLTEPRACLSRTEMYSNLSPILLTVEDADPDTEKAFFSDLSDFVISRLMVVFVEAQKNSSREAGSGTPRDLFDRVILLTRGLVLQVTASTSRKERVKFSTEDSAKTSEVPDQTQTRTVDLSKLSKSTEDFLADVLVALYKLSCADEAVSPCFLQLFSRLVSVHIPHSASVRLNNGADKRRMKLAEDLRLEPEVCCFTHNDNVGLVTRLMEKVSAQDGCWEFIAEHLVPALCFSERKGSEQLSGDVVTAMFAFLRHMEESAALHILSTLVHTSWQSFIQCQLIEQTLKTAQTIPACKKISEEKTFSDQIEKLAQSLVVVGSGDVSSTDTSSAGCVWRMLASVLSSRCDGDAMSDPCVNAVISSCVVTLGHLTSTDNNTLSSADHLSSVVGLVQALLHTRMILTHPQLGDLVLNLLRLLLIHGSEQGEMCDLEQLWLKGVGLVLQAKSDVEIQGVIVDMCNICKNCVTESDSSVESLNRVKRVAKLLLSCIISSWEPEGVNCNVDSRLARLTLTEGTASLPESDARAVCDVADKLLIEETTSLQDQKKFEEFLYVSKRLPTLPTTESSETGTEARPGIHTVIMASLFNLSICETVVQVIERTTDVSTAEGSSSPLLSDIQIHSVARACDKLVLLEAAGKLGTASDGSVLNSLGRTLVSQVRRCVGSLNSSQLERLVECLKEECCYLSYASCARWKDLSLPSWSQWAVGTNFIRRCDLTEDIVLEVSRCLEQPKAGGASMCQAFNVMIEHLLSVECDSTDIWVENLCKCISGVFTLAKTGDILDNLTRLALFKSLVDLVNGLKVKNIHLATSSDITAPVSASLLQLNVCVARALRDVLMPGCEHYWEFTLCTLVEWIQFLCESEKKLKSDACMQALAVSVFDLASDAASTFNNMAVASADTESSSAVSDKSKTEWSEFFSEGMFSPLLPLFVTVATTTTHDDKGWNPAVVSLILSPLSATVGLCPAWLVLDHQLPARLTVSDTSGLPDSIKTLLNHACPLLMSRHRCVEVAAYLVIKSVLGEVVKQDSGTDGGADEARSGSAEEEEGDKSPPEALMMQVEAAGRFLDCLKVVQVDDHIVMDAGTEERAQAMGYLLAWRLLLLLFQSAEDQLRARYAEHFKTEGSVSRLLDHLFRLMPQHPSEGMTEPGEDLTVGDTRGDEMEWLALQVYRSCLEIVPALVRAWWVEQDRKSSNFVDCFTREYLSQGLISRQITSAQGGTTGNAVEGITIRTRVATREVLATYEMAEVTVNMTITLPENFPLGKLAVSCDKRVGVSQGQWDRWLLQLNIFLQHQNGSIVEGLRLWKANLDKKFDGIDDCMICFSVIHGTNFQLPRLTCRTCRKKFHSACLYKWFSTSQKSSCPLCRELF